MRSFKTKVCQICSQEYQPTSGRQKYCVECGPAVKAAKQKICCAKWDKANPEKVRASGVKCRKVHPESHRAANTKYRKANLEKVRALAFAWSKKNLEKKAAWDVKYRATPEKKAVRSSQRRAAKYANTPISEMLTSTEWLAILAEAGGHCAYCDKEAKLTLDHVIPLSKGGKHSKDNVVAACSHCNSSKGNKTLEEWLCLCEVRSR